jgi:hypothetical protein
MLETIAQNSAQNASVEFFLREENGKRSLYDENNRPFLSVNCYCIAHKNLDLSKTDIKDRKELIQLIDMLLGNIADISPYQAEHVCNPHIKCGEAYQVKTDPLSKMDCCTHYFIGIAMMQEIRNVREETITKIEQQHLTGYIPVDIMADFNMLNHEIRVATEYLGNSIDVYCSRLSPAKRRTDFKEFKDENEAKIFLYDFFKKI